MAETVVGRFAPSPSGRMHLGNVFTAFLAWCSVRAQDGRMILRIEDLDPDRCRKEYAAQLREDLLWLGLDWDAEQTPQSQRTQAYREQFDRLEKMGLLYPCYCTRDALHAASAPHASDGTPVYSGACRGLSEQQRARMTRKPAWRVRVPNEEISFADGLQGEYRENLERDCGDFIVRRSDGVYAYQLAVVTDDAQANVSQIVRGRDLLGSTPRQIFLQKTLGFSQPQYFHVPLLVAADGRRLSKRERDLDMGALKTRYCPQELLGYLAFLAGLQEEPAPLSAEKAVEIFSWSRVKQSNIPI